jgi:hypothetical protein
MFDGVALGWLHLRYISLICSRYDARPMSDRIFENIEAGLRFAQTRSAVLAEDVANARTPGFVARDAQFSVSGDEDSPRFATMLHDVQARGQVGILEFAMGAQAKNAVTYRALADQEHAMLRELRTVAEEARR